MNFRKTIMEHGKLVESPTNHGISLLLVIHHSRPRTETSGIQQLSSRVDYLYNLYVGFENMETRPKIFFSVTTISNTHFERERERE